jgi:hypothetical protein
MHKHSRFHCANDNQLCGRLKKTILNGKKRRLGIETPEQADRAD